MKTYITKIILTTLLIPAVLALKSCKEDSADPNGNTGENKGVLAIESVTAWVDYPPSEFFPKINGEPAEEPLTYVYDESRLSIDASAHTVTALAAGTYDVKATYKGNAVSFKVIAQKIDLSDLSVYNTSSYDEYAALLDDKWAKEGNVGVTTLFIGDSYFDVRNHWTNFYDTYKGKDALCFGIGGSTSYCWEIYSYDGWFGKLKPKNIVVNVGQNNLYGNKTGVETSVALQRMFTLMHGRMPDAKIYWFNVVNRISFDATKRNNVDVVNDSMRAWCEERGWITYIPVTLTDDMRKDDTHPKLEAYSVYTEALSKTDIEIADKN